MSQLSFADEITQGIPNELPPIPTEYSKTVNHAYIAIYAPYSMNILLNELFNKFGGVFLEVCETI